jgi:protein TonB
MKDILFSVMKLNLILLLFFTTIGFAQEENRDVPFTALEEVPKFDNCSEVAKENGVSCFMQMMNRHIAKNFRYPVKAREKNIQGRVNVFFTINEIGNVSNIRTTAPKGCELLELEAIRIIKLLPKFEPGIQKGQPVSVSYVQPINFKLN